jgi:hypothetical protein
MLPPQMVEIGLGHTVLTVSHQTGSPACDGNDAHLVPSLGNTCHDHRQTKPSLAAPTQ